MLDQNSQTKLLNVVLDVPTPDIISKLTTLIFLRSVLNSIFFHKQTDNELVCKYAYIPKGMEKGRWNEFNTRRIKLGGHLYAR